MKRILLLLILFTCTAHAEDNDTYNFYFQKAPGPVTVNQGAAGAKNPDAIAAPAAAAVTAQAPEAAAPYSHFEFSLGYGMLRDGSEWLSRSDGLSSLSGGGRYTIGLQYTVIPLLGIQAEGTYLVKASDYLNSRENKLDYALGAVITPIRFSPFSWLGVSVSGILGVMSVPVEDTTFKRGSNGFYDSQEMSLTHVTTPYLGGRLNLSLGNAVALQAGLRKITKFDGTLETLSLAFLL